MKTIASILLLCVLTLAGCSTPGKVIATTSTTVDHAMQGWAVHVVNGNSTPAEELAVRNAHAKYVEAEDAAIEANIAFAKTGSKDVWLKARDYMRSQGNALVGLIELFTNNKKATP